VPRKFAGNLTEDQLYTYALKSKKNVSIQGHAGTGKTTSLMTFSAKNGLEFGSMSCNAGVEPSQFFGRYVPNAEGKLVWRDGLFTHFFRNGGVLVIDEANFLPQKIASVLHGVLDDRRVLTLLEHDGEVITANENFGGAIRMAAADHLYLDSHSSLCLRLSLRLCLCWSVCVAWLLIVMSNQAWMQYAQDPSLWVEMRMQMLIRAPPCCRL
jgi:hypothetical protein